MDSDAIIDDQYEPEIEPAEEEFYEMNDNDVDRAFNLEDIMDEIVGASEDVSKDKQIGASSIEYVPEPQGIIDPLLTECSMMTLLKSEVKRKRIAGYHIDSINLFYRVGIRQIVTKLFSVKGRIRNERDKTEDDKEIAEIAYEVNFVDIDLSPPQTTKYKSGAVQMQTPAMSRDRNLTYSAPMALSTEITVTAYLRNGGTKVRTAKVTGHRIGSILCMVGSDLDNLARCSRETKKQLEEDPNDPGGYFIIKGAEWVINSLESNTNNSFQVRRNAYQHEICRGTILSKPGDTFENSYQTIIRFLDNGAITVEVTTGKFEKFEIPFYLVFRALGITRDRDICNHIVYGVDNEDPVTRQMMNILHRSFEADDAKFGSIRKSTNPHEIIEFIASGIVSANTMMAKKDDNVAKYLNNNVLGSMDRYLLPHISTQPEGRIKKLRYLGYLINRLLLVHMNVIDPVDPDSYKNKRVLAAGTSMSKIFKTNFNFAVVQEIRKHLVKDFKSTPFSSVHLEGAIKSAVNSDQLERLLVQAITSGNKVITVKRNEIINRVSTQTLYRKCDMNMFSTLGTINVPNSSAAKQTERADLGRRFHQSSLGFVDASQSPDTGEEVGRTRQYCISSSLSAASSTFILNKLLEEDPDIIPVDSVTQPERITAEKLTFVWSNGYWIGFCKEAHSLVAKYRSRRRHGDIHYSTSIVKEPLTREISFWTDVGRMIRPVTIVYNNIDEYRTLWRKGDHTVQFNQWIRLTQNHVNGLRSGSMVMDDLRSDRAIEYISPEEQETTFMSPNIDTLRTNVNSLRHQYTHCDIDQSILGIVTLAAPMANHSNAVRNTMYTNHRKQSCSWPTTNYPFRMDKGATLQHYCEQPLVSTLPDSLTYPSGLNTIVALIMHGGDNCEDSLKMNQSSVDCGMFNASVYNYEKVELDKGEQFGNPDYARTIDIKKNANYEFIRDGFIAEGTLIKRDYVLIVRAAKIPKPTDQFMYVDKSIVYRKDEPAYVERVVRTRNNEDAVIAKVKWRADRPLGVGDKLCMTPDHDVLTTRGWIPIADVTLDDKVACKDSCGLRYINPTAVHTYDHNGDMYTVESAGICACVTIDHKMYTAEVHEEYEIDTSLTYPAPYNDNPEFSLAPAREIIGKRRYYCNSIRSLSYSTVMTVGDLPNSLPLPDYVWQLSMMKCREIMKGFMDVGSIITKNHADIGEYQRLALHCGWSSRVISRGTGDACVYLISVDLGTHPIVNSGNNRNDRIEKYSGKVHCLTVPTGIFMVRYRDTMWWSGNSSRTGNKGVVANAVPRCDMPVCTSGLIPDICGNPLSIPTRMAVNQLTECNYGWVAAIYGTHIDATAFRKHDTDAALEFLRKNGIIHGGHERMYNGKTGLWLDVEIFIGPTTYQRLQKFVIDEHYATRAGPTSAVTHQPLDGKNNDGGLRIGEMEKDVYTAQGVMRSLHEKFYKDSDGVDIPVCRTCKSRAVVNEKLSLYKCKKCGDMADIAIVSSAWSANLFMSEIEAMNAKMSLVLEPHTYPIPETD